VLAICYIALERLMYYMLLLTAHCSLPLQDPALLKQLILASIVPRRLTAADLLSAGSVTAEGSQQLPVASPSAGECVSLLCLLLNGGRWHCCGNQALPGSCAHLACHCCNDRLALLSAWPHVQAS
jgi:hypothetical protein